MITKYESFSLAIASLHQDIQRIERMEMAKYGLKGPHAQCLLAMRRRSEGVTAAQLCAICEKDKAAISRSLSELEAVGLLRRCERNGVRYRAVLQLTDRGLEAARNVEERALLAVEQAGEGLTDEKREVFYSVLALIAGNLHTICRDGLKEREEA